MKGRLRPRGPDVWQIVVDAPRQSGDRRDQRYRTVRGKKKEADDALRKFIREIEIEAESVEEPPPTVQPKPLTVRAYLDEWLESRRDDLSPTTLDRYAMAVKTSLTPDIESLPLADLRRADLKRLYTHLRRHGRRRGGGGLSARSVRHVHTILKTALNEAVAEELIPGNPAFRIKVGRVIDQERAVLDEAQAQALLERAKITPLHIPVRLALSAGLRRSEILGLRWRDVSFDEKRLTVKQVLVRGGGVLHFKEPKNKRMRHVSLPPSTITALEAFKTMATAVQIAGGKKLSPDALVCPSTSGAAWHPASFGSTWAWFIKRQTDLPQVTFHGLRHTHATLLLRAGVSPKAVSMRLGHANIGITLDIYSHVLPDMQEDAAARIDIALGSDASTLALPS